MTAPGQFIAYRRAARTMPPQEPAVAVRSKGGIAVNKAAFGLLTKMLGCRPAKLELLYCPAMHTIGIRGQVDNLGHYFKVFQVGIGSSMMFTAFASAFFDRFGLTAGNVDLETWCPAYVPDGTAMLLVPLARPDVDAVVTSHSVP